MAAPVVSPGSAPGRYRAPRSAQRWSYFSVLCAIGEVLVGWSLTHASSPVASMHRQRVPAFLAKLRLSHGAVSVEGTPRRLVVTVEGLAARQSTEEGQVSGAGVHRGEGGKGGRVAAYQQGRASEIGR